MMPKTVYYKQNNGQLSKSAPRHLGPIAAACWRQIVPYLISTGKVERIDSHVVERYCIAYETYRKCYDDILQNGEKIEIIKDVQDNTGKVIDKVTTRIQANPMERLKKDASAEMTELGQQLGLSPKSRQELQQLAGEKKEKKSTAQQLQQFFNKNKGGDS